MQEHILSARKMVNFAVVLSLIGGAYLYALDKPKDDSDFVFSIRGYYSGTGTGTRQSANAILSADITADDGVKGQLNAVVKIKGNHFEGEGSILGKKVTLSGRVDGPGHGKGKKLDVSRVIGTYAVEDGHRGRLVGAAATATIDGGK